MAGIADELDGRGIRGVWKRGQYYVRLDEMGASLKIREIDSPESFSRADEGDKFVVRKEGMSGNMWAEYFSTLDELGDFVEEKYDK